MRDLMRAAAEWLRADAAVKCEELRLLELGTYSRGYEEGMLDVKEQFGIEVAYEQAADPDDE